MYYLLKNGKVVTDRQVIDAVSIVNGKTITEVDMTQCKGITKKIENPDIEKLVENGQLNMAASIFAEQNKNIGMTVVEAKNFLRKKYEVKKK